MTSRPRASHLRDDLLADLRQVTPPAAAAPPEAEEPAPADPATPSLDVRISRQAWSFPRLEPVPGRAGLVLSGGPLHVRLGFSRG